MRPRRRSSASTRGVGIASSTVSGISQMQMSSRGTSTGRVSPASCTKQRSTGSRSVMKRAAGSACPARNRSSSACSASSRSGALACSSRAAWVMALPPVSVRGRLKSGASTPAGCMCQKPSAWRRALMKSALVMSAGAPGAPRPRCCERRRHRYRPTLGMLKRPPRVSALRTSSVWAKGSKAPTEAWASSAAAASRTQAVAVGRMRTWFMCWVVPRRWKNSTAAAGQPVTSRASCSSTSAVPLRRR